MAQYGVLTKPSEAEARDSLRPSTGSFIFEGYDLAADRRSSTSSHRVRIPTSGSSVAEPDAVLEEDGRTYNGYQPGAYFLPNDAAEQDRLDFQHALCRLQLDGKLTMAPVQCPANVLDIATGTGIWAIEFAEQNPDSNVIGTDLSLIQPMPRVPNVSFVREDAEMHEWIFPQKFDYVHLRLVLTCFNDTRTVIRKAFDHMNPGGWIEFHDTSFELRSLDGTLDGTVLERWAQLVMKGGAALGRDLAKSKHYKAWLEEAGFVDVVERFMPGPVNPWPAEPKLKRMGLYAMHDLLDLLGGLRNFLLAAGLPGPEIEELTDQVRRDAQDTSIHAFWLTRGVYGRKP